MRKKRFEPEGSEKYNEVNNNIKRCMEKAKENWRGEQCSEIEENRRKKNSKRAYQLVKDLTTVEQGKATTVQDRSGKCLTVITSTLFQLKDRFKVIWRYPRSKDWHQCETRDILHTRVMPSANCCTDHSQVHCKVVFTFRSPPERKGPQMKKLQVHRLRDRRVKNNFHVRGDTSFCDSCRT